MSVPGQGPDPHPESHEQPQSGSGWPVEFGIAGALDIHVISSLGGPYIIRGCAWSYSHGLVTLVESGCENALREGHSLYNWLLVWPTLQRLSQL